MHFLPGRLVYERGWQERTRGMKSGRGREKERRSKDTQMRGGMRGGEQSDGRSGKPGSDGSLGVRAVERWRRRKRASKKHALSLSLSLSRAGRKAKRNDRDSHGGESGAFTLRTTAFFPSSALSSNPNPRHRDAMVVGTATSPASVILVSPRQCSSRLPPLRAF